MELINTILGIPLGYILYFAYTIIGDYGLAILVFALAVRIVLFPVSILAHNNSLRLLKIQPTLNQLKIRYSGEKELLNEEQYNLFKKEKYNPFIGIVPLLIQLFLVIGMLQVMYNPLQHMLHLEKPVIEILVQTTRELSEKEINFGEQLLALEAANRPENLGVYRDVLAGLPNGNIILEKLLDIDLYFLGLNMGEIPSITRPSMIWLIPLLSGITAIFFCLVQMKLSPGALGQGAGTNNGLTIFTVVFSVYFAFVTPAGVGLYWTAGNVFGIAILLILNVMYNPWKLAGDAINKIKATQKTPTEKKEERIKSKALKIREKVDADRFMKAEKRLVFYALTSGQYKFYKNIIEFILANSDITIHYLTNDPNDAVFSMNEKKLIPYYISQQKTISMMLKLETDILATTVLDLQTYHLKRSIVKNDIEYIYIEHGPASTHLTARETAYDHYDTIFCTGPHHVAEMRRREEMTGFKRKNLIKAGYGLYDQLVASYAAMVTSSSDPRGDNETPVSDTRPQILIAPSWQNDNIMELCLKDMLDALMGKGFKVIVRPHPQYVKMFAEEIAELSKQYAQSVADGELFFESDFASNDSIFMSDILITDWSGIAFEFSYCTLKPCVFINTPMKVMNPNWEQYGLEVLDITLRDKVGVSIEVTEIEEKLAGVVTQLLDDRDDYKDIIEGIVGQHLYYPGRSGEAGGTYILRRLGVL